MERQRGSSLGTSDTQNWNCGMEVPCVLVFSLGILRDLTPKCAICRASPIRIYAEYPKNSFEFGVCRQGKQREQERQLSPLTRWAKGHTLWGKRGKCGSALNRLSCPLHAVGVQSHHQEVLAGSEESMQEQQRYLAGLDA